MSNFQTIEVVDRGSETQSQVVENINLLSRIRVISQRNLAILEYFEPQSRCLV